MGARIGCAWLLLASVMAGCEDAPPGADGGGAGFDGGARMDAGSALDASGAIDAARADAAIADAATEIDAGAVDAGADAGSAVEVDAGSDAGVDGGPPDAGTRVTRVRVLADGACSGLAFDPPSISVPAGTSFTVEWINATGCTDIDIDMGGTVPIVIGLEPGMRYHDTIREWCGSFTGTYVFRAYYSPSFPAYLDVDCSS
jgi:hypothetical protein